MGGIVSGLFGGGSNRVPYGASGTGQGASVYSPTGQPQADSAYNNLLNAFQQGGYGIPGIPTSPAVEAYPSEAAWLNNLLGNPFAPQATAGAQTGAGYGQAAAAQAAGNTDLLQSLLPTFDYNARQATSVVPAYQQLGGVATGVIPGYQQLAGQAAAPIASLQGGAQNLLSTGYDPQSALYGDLLQRTQGQAAAQNAMAGLGSSPYGAGLASDALSGFNIDWENQQLGRQAQALQGAGAANAQAGGLAGLSANILSGIPQAAGVGANILSGIPQAETAGVNILGQIPRTAAQNLALGSAAGQEAASSAGMPYQTQEMQGQNAQQALSNFVNQGMQQYTLPQQLMNDLQSYLNLGQAASGLSAYAGNLGNQQTQQGLGNLGGLAGLGSNFLFGNQGISGALGLNPQTGLLGNVFGSGGLFGGGGGNLPDIFSQFGDATAGAGGAGIFSFLPPP